MLVLIGKSTILKLLNRLYDPTEGKILIDGLDICSLRLSDLRNCVSVLFQDYTHFPLSVRPFDLMRSLLIHIDRSKKILVWATLSTLVMREEYTTLPS